MELNFIFKNDKKKIIERLAYYGIEELPFLLIESGKEKIRGYSGSLSVAEIHEIEHAVRIELVGMYLFHEYKDEIRLSFDAIYALKDKITKNIIEITDKQAEEFLKGRDILLMKEDEEKFKSTKEEHGFKVIKNQGDLIGFGKLIDGRIINYMPKERRLR